MEASQRIVTWPGARPLDETTVEYVGRETLRRFANVENYNRWIMEEVEPYVGDRILEVGCGIGNITAYLAGRELVVGLDVDCESVNYLRNKFPAHVFIEGDITDARLAGVLGGYDLDTAVCINVLEHIEDDFTALANIREALRPGGRLVLYVPAGTRLFGTLDLALGHWRRYSAGSVEDLATAAGFEVVRLGYMNLAGVLGWWLNGKLLRRRILPENQLGLFNALAPMITRAERLVRKVRDVPFGLSVVCVGFKR